MKVLAVTTFNESGLEIYGRRMVASLRENWGVALRVYAEGWSDSLKGAETVDLLSSSPWLSEFKGRHTDRPTRNYRMDAVRFAHKVAAVCHAASDFDGDMLIWIDGDVIVHSPVPTAALELISPGAAWISWLDRAKHYPECGLYALNCNHPRHRVAIHALERMYTDDALFSLPEWHDSFVLEHVVKSLGMSTKSLSGQGRDTTHPMVNGPMGEWFDHAKGPRKTIGRTPANELKFARQEPYWNAC